MKSFALFCFLLLASACVFVARAEEEAAAVDSAKLEDTPHALEQADEEQADAEQADEEQADEEKTEADEEETEADEEKTEADEEETEADEKETEADETENDEEAEEDEEETTDLADDEPEKRGWACKRYARKGYSYCRKCGCSYGCKRCTRRYCKKYQCGTRKICKTYYKTVQYKQILPNNYWIRRYKSGYKGGYKGRVGYNGGHGRLGGYKGGHRGRIGYNGGHGGLGGYKGGHRGRVGYNGGHGGLGGYKGGYRPRYVLKYRKVPYVKCKHYAKYCKKCYKKSYKCHCGTKCGFNKCYRPTTYTPHYG